MNIANSDSKKDQITILRIKRKRTEEPLDALLLHQENEKRAKKNDDQSKKGSELKISGSAFPTLFRLAETVEQQSFSNPDEAKKLKDRIMSRRMQGHTVSASIEDKKDRLVEKQKEVSMKARYRLVHQNRQKAAATDDAPPTVKSSSEKAAQDLFNMFEAVKEGDKDKKKSKANLLLDDDIDDPDDIMCNFIPMVKEYLTLQDRDGSDKEDDDDYVYDVYYKEDADMVGQQNISSMNVGSLVWFDDESEYVDDNDTDSEPGDELDEDSNAEDYYQNDYPDEEDSDDFEDDYGYEVVSSEDDEDYTL